MWEMEPAGQIHVRMHFGMLLFLVVSASNESQPRRQSKSARCDVLIFEPFDDYFSLRDCSEMLMFAVARFTS
jgi:hypothetical protein